MFSTTSIANLLGLSDKNLKLTGEISSKLIKNINYRVIEGIITYKPKVCPHCGVVNENYSIVKNGSQKVKILLNRISNNPSILEVKKQRFYCKHCKKTFMAQTSLTDKGCFISKDVKLSVIDSLTEIMPMKVIAKNHYISNTTVSRVLRSTIKKNNKQYLPKKLAIDEFKSTKIVDSSMSVNLTDIETGQIFDIVSDRKKQNLNQYFSSYPVSIRNRVEIVTTDMYPTYIDLAKTLFPNAKIVLDKFHIVQLFTRDMNKFRVYQMKKFRSNSHEYRVLKRYWKVILAKDWELNSVHFYKCYCYKKHTNMKNIKEDILSFCPELKNANNFYQEFLRSIESTDINLFKALLDRDINEIPECFRKSIKSLNKYREYAINSLETGYTNACVEGNNNLIKSFKRVSYGFRSYKNMKNRLLLRNKFKAEKNSRIKNLLDSTA